MTKPEKPTPPVEDPLPPPTGGEGVQGSPGPPPPGGTVEPPPVATPIEPHQPVEGALPLPAKIVEQKHTLYTLGGSKPLSYEGITAAPATNPMDIRRFL